MGDDGAWMRDLRNFDEGHVAETNSPHGDMNALWVLAHSAELMSQCEGDFDRAHVANQNSEDRTSIGKCLDEMHISAYVSENDGFHSRGNLTHSSQVQHQARCENDSLVQDLNEEPMVEPLQRRNIRLTQIRRLSRSKHLSTEQQKLEEYKDRYLGGRGIRLTQLRRLARSCKDGISELKHGHVNCHTYEDDQGERMISKQCENAASCQIDCNFPEVENIDGHDMHEGANQPAAQMWCGQIENSGKHAYTAQPPEDSNSGTPPTTGHQIARVVSDYGELGEQQHVACQLRAPSTSNQEGQLRDQQLRGQQFPSLELTTFNSGLNAEAENKTESAKGRKRLSHLKSKARLPKSCN